MRGAVQGVGFRPFVYGLAGRLGLAGWVCNGPAGVELEVEGAEAPVAEFLGRLPREAPPRARIEGLEPTWLDPAGLDGFVIRPSRESGERTVLILPDIATCADCLAELFDPSDRRHRYPFINCTHCGPRYSIVRRLPYDRAQTTMAGFPLCEACRREYEDPGDRRFHAQPTACPVCGPRLAWWTAAGDERGRGEEALGAAVAAIRAGQVVAVKGLGGFHLVADATHPAAVARLRERKRRGEKPFAVMAPGRGWVREACAVSPLEERLLESPEAPIVLLHRRGDGGVCEAVAPGNPLLGVMLPYTPLHHLLLHDLGRPIVATSGNRSEEPICIDEAEAVVRLGGLADAFLVHDRPIARPVDDSVVRVVLGREQVIRRARGYAPLPVRMPVPVDGLLAVGGHLKNTVALGVGRNLFVSQHIGDLDTEAAYACFRSTVADLQALFEVSARRVACDLHPDYRSTRFAAASGLPVHAIQHHYAHIAAAMAENELAPPVLGLSWDGTGYGPDGSVWGGEILEVGADGTWRRAGHLRGFPLPGGYAAVREPRRAAVGLLRETFGSAWRSFDHLAPVRAFAPAERELIDAALVRGLNCPLTSSMGRLFDGVAALLDLRQVSAFEGQAAMAVEFAARAADDPADYPFAINGVEIDWRPMLRALLDDLRDRLDRDRIAARFHNTLVGIGVAFAGRLGADRIVLSGGCFQNEHLSARLAEALRARGARVYTHQRIPPNDGGICVGQAALAGSAGGPGLGPAAQSLDGAGWRIDRPGGVQ